MQFSQAPPLSGSNGSLVKTLQFTVRFGDFGLFSDQQFDSTIDSGAERSVRIGDVDLGQQRPTARLQRRRDPRDLAGKGPESRGRSPLLRHRVSLSEIESGWQERPNRVMFLCHERSLQPGLVS
jgi:hypothetical protein